MDSRASFFFSKAVVTIAAVAAIIAAVVYSGLQLKDKALLGSRANVRKARSPAAPPASSDAVAGESVLITKSVNEPAVSSTASAHTDDARETLKAQREGLEEKSRQDNRAFRLALEEFVAKQPALAKLYAQHKQYQNAFERGNNGQIEQELGGWTFGPPIEVSDPLFKQRKEEVGRLRQFLILHEIDQLLADPTTESFVRPWLSSRLQTLGQASAGGFNSCNQAQAYEWRIIGDSVLPDAAVLKQLLATSSRQEMISRYAEKKGLGSVDASMPALAEEYLRSLLHWAILRDAAYAGVWFQLPPNLLQLEAKALGQRMELGDLNAKVQKPPPPRSR